MQTTNSITEIVIPSHVPLIYHSNSTVKTLFVSGEPVVLDLNGEDGDWLIETEPDRILFISLSGDGASDILKHSLKVLDFLLITFNFILTIGFSKQQFPIVYTLFM